MVKNFLVVVHQVGLSKVWGINCGQLLVGGVAV